RLRRAPAFPTTGEHCPTCDVTAVTAAATATAAAAAPASTAAPGVASSGASCSGPVQQQRRPRETLSPQQL
ncbi:unnamed protein product, partial [Closterium sp. NIES-53]